MVARSSGGAICDDCSGGIKEELHIPMAVAPEAAWIWFRPGK